MDTKPTQPLFRWIANESLILDTEELGRPCLFPRLEYDTKAEVSGCIIKIAILKLFVFIVLVPTWGPERGLFQESN